MYSVADTIQKEPRDPAWKAWINETPVLYRTLRGRWCQRDAFAHTFLCAMQKNTPQLIEGFSLPEALERFQNLYERRLRAGDASFGFLNDIIATLARDFGGLESIALQRNLHHALYVTETMQSILASLNVSSEDMTVGLTTALLHDIGYLLILDRYSIDQCEERDVRREHMAYGAQYARRILAETSLDRYFSPTNRSRISDLIAIHDDPSTRQDDGARGKPLNVADVLSYSLREADRLWMTSRDGFRYDLMRLERKTKRADPSEQLSHVVDRYQEEKMLYLDDGGFQDGTLFRSPVAYKIFLEQTARLREEYGLTNE